jgi:hypothetical protein
MATKAELMATGMPASQANKLGLDPTSSVTAAGTTLATATVLAGNNSNVTTSSIGGGVQLQGDFDQAYVYNAGPNTLTIYPPSASANFIGLAAGVGATVAAGSGATCWPSDLGITFNISGP